MSSNEQSKPPDGGDAGGQRNSRVSGKASTSANPSIPDFWQSCASSFQPATPHQASDEELETIAASLIDALGLDEALDFVHGLMAEREAVLAAVIAWIGRRNAEAEL